MSKLKFVSNSASFEDVVNDGFDQTSDGFGFEYIVGKIKGGDLKVVFEPEGTHESIVIDGVDGFGYILAFEE